MAITRTIWQDDDGTGTTGTVINNNEKTIIYNQIDASCAFINQANTFADRQTVNGSSPGAPVAVVNANDPTTTTELLIFQRSDGAVRGSIQTVSTTGHLNIGTTSSHGFDVKTGGQVRLALDATGAVQLPAYTGTTFAAGDKYLVVDASGNVHRSAIGPAS